VSTVEMTVSAMWTGEYHDRRLVSEVDDDQNSHIHGKLVIVIAGRTLPHLGFFGIDDVCLNDWVEELCLAVQVLGSSKVCEHVFDEGEQGQPAFRFRRDGERVLVSVIDSKISCGRRDATWTDVVCDAQDFIGAANQVLESIRQEVCHVAGEAGDTWWASVYR